MSHILFYCQAVALLLCANRYLRSRGIVKFLIIQVICLIGLMPLTLFWFSYGAINGFFANLVAIPWIGYVVVPLALLSLAAIHLLSWPKLLIPVTTCIHWFMYYLQAVSHFSMINITHPLVSSAQVVGLCLGLLIIWLIPNKKFFPAALILIMSSFIPQGFQLKQNEARVVFLDVGQGLAVVVSTQNHTLIYDTGVKFYKGNDMGAWVILPYLNYWGVQKIDKIVISHPDLDHRGGLRSLETHLKVGELIVDDIAYYKRGKGCHDYPPWTWDGVKFQFLPMQAIFTNKNNRSCVLRIHSPKGTVLLTGDIEKQAEAYLMKNYAKILPADLLLIPHHGSSTSSSEGFLQAVSPKYAIISSGFDNRYHFPHTTTVNKLIKFKINSFNTATCGQITFVLGKNKIYKPNSYITCG